MLFLLNDYLAKADAVILEVEDPKYADSEKEKDIQTRRLLFYLRNDCVDTGSELDASAFRLLFYLWEKKMVSIQNLFGKVTRLITRLYCQKKCTRRILKKFT